MPVTEGHASYTLCHFPVLVAHLQQLVTGTRIAKMSLSQPPHPPPAMLNRTVRIFISSTFRDFGEERDLLMKRVFPELRRRARDRFVEVIGVDLRWGVTEEDSQKGETLPICLREIERSRP